MIRVGEGRGPQVARFAFDLGSVTFANAWVAFGSLSVGSGWAMLTGRAQPAWLGWWAIAAGVGFLASRAVWTTYVWLIPYAMFWLWVLVLSTRSLARGCGAPRSWSSSASAVSRCRSTTSGCPRAS